ncbi:F0F1 ATP synthase subunit B family protein [Candidatus Liberibacter brunswickensis]|uniref:F0F1 ATP synthase subunit B family protein n=1 Tax=Candidatus Liberibacter brunswickensis TaxID=1968796 RepID=UPI002FE1D39C
MYFDETFLVFTSLLIFLVILLYLRVPSIVLSFLDAHADKIRDEILGARSLREESENILVQYREKFRAAEKEVSDIILSAQNKAETIEEDNNRYIEKVLSLSLINFEKKIKRMELEAKISYYTKVTDLSIEVIREIISKNVNVNNSINDRIFDDLIINIKSRS